MCAFTPRGRIAPAPSRSCRPCGPGEECVIGSRHCFHDIADTDGDLIWLGSPQEPPVIDADARQVTLHGGR